MDDKTFKVIIRDTGLFKAAVKLSGAKAVAVQCVTLMNTLDYQLDKFGEQHLKYDEVVALRGALEQRLDYLLDSKDYWRNLALILADEVASFKEDGLLDFEMSPKGPTVEDWLDKNRDDIVELEDWDRG